MSGARGWIVLALAAALCGCDVSSGGPPGKVAPGVTATPMGLGSPSPSAVPRPTPTATPTPAPVRLSPPALTFASPAAPAQTVAIAETGYAGTFAVDATACTGILTVALAPNTQSFTVTPSAAGTCTLIVRDTQSNASTLPVTVSP
ncbi:MAG: hypothetical protein JWN27_2355 [Candidatus Eremiobacteraeota bacterium]|nr:hypothetical protein [Candidatus Eremiobacteraeota bacterium]